VERQKLHARFGQPDHESRIERSRDYSCDCELQRRREASVAVTGSKKRSSPFQMRVRKKRRYV
jgi:hypothetical protein